MSHFDDNLSNLREAMGIMQHHDAVTGTEKQHVAEDYARLLQIGIDKCSENVKESLNQLTVDAEFSDVMRNHRYNKNFRFDFAPCADLNISTCVVTENTNKFMVTVYNPIAHSVSQNVRVPISDIDYEILDYRSVPVVSQTVTVPDGVLALNYRHSNAASELVFTASNLPPLGYISYFVQKKTQPTTTATPKVIMVSNDYVNDDPFSVNIQSQPFTIGSKYLNLSFNLDGLLESASIDGAFMKVTQNFYVYEAAIGNNKEFKNRSSGAYIFRPNVTEAKVISGRAECRVIRGDVVDEVQQVN